MPYKFKYLYGILNKVKGRKGVNNNGKNVWNRWC